MSATPQNIGLFRIGNPIRVKLLLHTRGDLLPKFEIWRPRSSVPPACRTSVQDEFGELKKQCVELPLANPTKPVTHIIDANLGPRTILHRFVACYVGPS